MTTPTPEPERPTPESIAIRVTREILSYIAHTPSVELTDIRLSEHFPRIEKIIWKHVSVVTEERDKLKVERDEALSGLDWVRNTRDLYLSKLEEVRADRDLLAREVEELRARAEAAERDLETIRTGMETIAKWEANHAKLDQP